MGKIMVILALLAGCTAGQAPSGPDGKNRVVDIVNTSDMPLGFRAVRAENRGVLPRPVTGTVAPHYYRTFNFANTGGACLFDFIAKIQNTVRSRQDNFDTCKEVSWVVP